MNTNFTINLAFNFNNTCNVKFDSPCTPWENGKKLILMSINLFTTYIDPFVYQKIYHYVFDDVMKQLWDRTQSIRRYLGKHYTLYSMIDVHTWQYPYVCFISSRIREFSTFPYRDRQSMWGCQNYYFTKLRINQQLLKVTSTKNGFCLNAPNNTQYTERLMWV